MYLLRTLGAALLAVPLAAAGGQSASQHGPPAAAASDSTSSNRFVWAATATAAGATVFTTFLRLSGNRAADLRSSLAIPGTPIPSTYPDGVVPGAGPSPSQNSPGGDSSQDSTHVDDGNDPGMTIFDIAIPPPPNAVVQDSTSLPEPPPPPGPESALAVVITTPEPDMIPLVGTGLVALIPMVRLRRSRA